MGFLSFNERYYERKLKEFENRDLSEDDIYEVKQLLKVLDDLADEGYTNLNNHMEADFSCLTRLRGILLNYGEKPFPVDHDRVPDTTYGREEYGLEGILNKFSKASFEYCGTSDDPLLVEMRKYSEWIEYGEDTAYIFLLRDALLPYMFFNSRKRSNIYPWLISRRFLEDITKTENMDDDIRLPLYEALEEGYTAFDDFSGYCKKRIASVLDERAELKAVLLELLGSIKHDKIMVIESGYMGTVPMMLKALDDRVDFRLYTTAPFLYETYKEKIFCRKYEDLRKFETVYSQDHLLRYSSYCNGKFYVNESLDNTVLDKALAEINAFI